MLDIGCITPCTTAWFGVRNLYESTSLVTGGNPTSHTSAHDVTAAAAPFQA